MNTIINFIFDLVPRFQGSFDLIKIVRKRHNYNPLYREPIETNGTLEPWNRTRASGLFNHHNSCYDISLNSYVNRIGWRGAR
jgi:hypothetical protein